MKNRKISLFLIILFILNTISTTFVKANNPDIQESITVQPIAEGVIRKNIIIVSDDVSYNINVVIADLNNANVNVEVVTPKKGLSYLDNVLNLSRNNNAVAAINADFFQWKQGASSRGSSIGPVFKDGKVISTPAHESGMASIVLDTERNIYVDYWSHQTTITAPNGNTAHVKHINKYDGLDSIVIYTPDWDTTSIGSFNNIVEVVVENDIITEIRREMPAIEIPENGYIIANLPEFDPFLIENFEVGDKVELNTSTAPDFSNLTMAVGGSAILVKDGIVPYKFSHNINGAHPRSAVGTDITRKLLYMVTVDGRQESSKGMTQYELAQLLVDIGVYNAINLDGGGSTTLVTRDPSNRQLQVTNTPFDSSYLRPVANAIAITLNDDKPNITKPLIVDDFETSNGSFVSYPNYVEGNYDISSDVKKNGNYSGKLSFDFTSESSDSKAAYVKFNNDGIDIDKNVSEIGVWVHSDGNHNLWLRGEIRDADNNVHRIDLSNKIDWEGWNYLQTSVPSNIPQPARLTRLYLVQIDADDKISGSIYFDDLTFIYDDSIKEEEPKDPDKDIPSELDNAFNLSVFGNTIKQEVLLDKLVMNNLVGKVNNDYDISAFVSNDKLDLDTLKEVNTPYFNTSDHDIFVFKESTFIHLDNSQGSFSETDNEQLEWFKKVIAENITTKNVFIFLPKPLTGVNGMTNGNEAELFKNIITHGLVHDDKSVFVIYNDDVTEFLLDGNINYISVQDIKNASQYNISDLVHEYKYVSISVDGEQVNCSIRNLFR